MIERPSIDPPMATPMSPLPEPAGVIASKSANIMTEFGDLSTLAKASLILSDGGGTLLFYEALKKFYGGTWVGGTATLTKTQLSFKPSVFNRLLPVKDASVTIRLNKIANVVVEKGFITKIICIETPELVLRLRCYGAADFAQKIRGAAQHA